MILVLDIGTSSVRGLLFDATGAILWKSQETYCIKTPMCGVATQNPKEVLDDIMKILSRARRWTQEGKERICAIAVTGQRSSVIPLSREGEVLGEALSWQDKRADSICRTFENDWESIYRITGMKLSSVFSAPKIVYLKQDQKEQYESAYKLTGFQEYILYHLTHQFVTDTTMASRTSLFDIRRMEWSQELIDLFGIDRDKLCSVIPVGSIAGYTTEHIRKCLGLRESIPVISAGGDQQCAVLGMGCQKAGDMAVNSGTGAYAAALVEEPVFAKDMSVNCNVSVLPGKWMAEGSVLCAGKAVEWFVKEFCADKEQGYREFTEACKRTPPGANGVVVSPSFSGRGTPFWNASVGAGIFNLRLGNKKEELFRALLEGIGAELTDCIASVSEQCNGNKNKIYASGGLMQNPEYGQMLSDMLGRKVYQPSVYEATGAGAWIVAAVALGKFPSYETACQCYSETMETMIWNPNFEVNRVYKQINVLRRKYEKIYDI